jgi:uncharacterized membrane protein SirB2
MLITTFLSITRNLEWLIYNYRLRIIYIYMHLILYAKSKKKKEVVMLLQTAKSLRGKNVIVQNS